MGEFFSSFRRVPFARVLLVWVAASCLATKSAATNEANSGGRDRVVFRQLQEEEGGGEGREPFVSWNSFSEVENVVSSFLGDSTSPSGETEVSRIPRGGDAPSAEYKGVMETVIRDVVDQVGLLPAFNQTEFLLAQQPRLETDGKTDEQSSDTNNTTTTNATNTDSPTSRAEEAVAAGAEAAESAPEEAFAALLLARPPPLDATRSKYPQCPLKCQDGWVKDNWCNEECNVKECDYDGGDCEGWCNSRCLPGWPGDGFCDKNCYTEACEWDGGDCEALRERGAKEINTNRSEAFDYSGCHCDKSLLDNGKCDMECNTMECRLDGLDCLGRCNSKCRTTWLGDGSCDADCDTPECLYDKGDCASCDNAGKCRAWMLGNGFCDAECNNAECGYDVPDCIGIVHVLGSNYTVEPYLSEFCSSDFIGDGFCDPVCLNEMGEYDGGDCIGEAVAEMVKHMQFRPEGFSPVIPNSNRTSLTTTTTSTTTIAPGSSSRDAAGRLYGEVGLSLSRRRLEAVRQHFSATAKRRLIARYRARRNAMKEQSVQRSSFII